MLDVGSIFSGKRVLLTGGAGFLGKVLLRMLVERYPEIGGVTLLIRGRGETSAQQRYEEEVLGAPALQGFEGGGKTAADICQTAGFD